MVPFYKKLLIEKRKEKMMRAIENHDNELFEKTYNYLQNNNYFQDDTYNYLPILKSSLDNENYHSLNAFLKSLESDGDLVLTLISSTNSFEMVQSFDDEQLDKLIKMQGNEKLNDAKNTINKFLSNIFYWSINLDRSNYIKKLSQGDDKPWHYDTLILGIYSYDKGVIDHLIDKIKHAKLVDILNASKEDKVFSRLRQSKKLKDGMTYYMNKKNIKEGEMMKGLFSNKSKVGLKNRKI